ncbi:hypothetical protein ACPCAC_32160 [Streptomyces lavendulocolor]|uniref:hypothetical protein n=1 Tax=Streptomyces lavendulocolor TaxID=67316 RepID=UPI003C2F1D04
MAAVAGLFFTGISTYYSSQTARDQLKQSVQDERDVDSRQAESVSIWPQREKNGGASLIITNRSLAPITEVYMKISVITEASTRQPGRVNVGNVGNVLSIRSLPPCTTVSLPPSAVRKEVGPAWTPDSALEADMLWFRDSRGRKWTREQTGSLRPTWLPPEGKKWTDLPTTPNSFSAPLRKQVTNARSAENCGSDN